MFSELDNTEMHYFLKSVEKRYGYDFSGYSKSSLKRRLERYLQQSKMESLTKLLPALLSSETLFVDFLQNITVNVTEMFRDPWFYKKLKEEVIPSLASYPFIKIWHAGCSTGEEVYSLAILLQEAGLLRRSRQYATDINPQVLNRAKEGVVSLQHMKEYTQNYLQAGGQEEFSQYYTVKDNQAHFDELLKQNMVFSIHNLVTDQSFNEFNLVICRNVLIYFDKDLQSKTIHLFTESLSPLGYLALGSKESLLFSEDSPRYETLDNKAKIYRLKS